MSSLGLPPCIPAHLEDEALYSYLARVQSLNGLERSLTFVESIFGPGRKTIRPELPTSLSALLERWPEGSPHKTLEDLVERTTQYPYHRTFMAREQWLATLAHAASGSPASGTSLGLAPHGFGLTSFLRSCPECDRESWLQHGAVYWHRVHLLPGVVACWRHHQQLIVHTKWTTGLPRTLLTPPLNGCSRKASIRAANWSVLLARTSAEALYAKEPGATATAAKRSATYLVH